MVACNHPYGWIHQGAMKQCPVCGTIDGQTKCTSCGADVQVSCGYCPNCGEAV